MVQNKTKFIVHAIRQLVASLTLYGLGLCSIYRVRNCGLYSRPCYGQWDWNVRFLTEDGEFCWPCDCPWLVVPLGGADGSDGGGVGGVDAPPTLECPDEVWIRPQIRCDQNGQGPLQPPLHSLPRTRNSCNLASLWHNQIDIAIMNWIKNIEICFEISKSILQINFKYCNKPWCYNK